MAMAPMATDFANPDGTVSKRLRDYFVARAQGGVGLITCEVTTVDANFPYMPKTLSLADDKLIPSFREFTDAIHEHGAKIVPQVAHPGPESLSPFFTQTRTVGPSPAMSMYTKQMCRELTVPEIEAIVEQFAEAARRAREAGFDGMELHAAHSYMLVGSFLSPLRNRRADAYGGSVDGRLKLPLDILASIRARVGRDFPIIMRISGDYLVEGGIDIRETQYMAPILAEAGVDAFHVSAGIIPDLSHRIMPPTGSPLAINAGLAAAVKEVVDVPVMVVGRINEPRLAEQVLRRGEADMVVMGRALLADPDFPNKAREGRYADIAPCIACGIGCVAARGRGLDMSCVINPSCGREDELVIRIAQTPRRVMVIGAGPAGMEAARIAAMRGHHVTLFEKEGKTGGQFNLAAMPPHKQELTRVIKYLTAQLEREGVEVQLETEVTPALVEKFAPDVAIVATGSEALVPPIPGIDGPRVVTALQVLAGEVPILPGKVLIIGGGMIGCETAEYMSKAGDNPLVGETAVTLVEMADSIANDTSPENRVVLLERLRKQRVEVRVKTKVKEFFEDGVVVEHGGQDETIAGVDRIVLCLGTKAVDRLSAELREKVGEVFTIGDSKKARSILEAIHEARDVARAI